MSQFRHQAKDSVTGAMFYWNAIARDWAGAGYPGPNVPT